MINIIIYAKSIQKISDRLYIIRICTFNKFIITGDRYNRYQISNRDQISGEMHVNYPKFIKFE